MLKNNDEYSESEKLLKILHGTGLAIYTANKDRAKYAKVKSGEEQELSEDESKSMSVLSILDGLGYPMNELGTYLYKEVIKETHKALEGVTGKRRDMEKCRAILAQLSDGFSQFYRNIAREDLEMGVKSFHLYIQQAISKIDSNAMDLDLVFDIFGPNPGELDYGLQAFQIAAYMMGFRVKKEIHPPIVKKLSNVPDDISLKYKF